MDAHGRECGMFALLEHTVPAADPEQPPSVHWDFLVEAVGLDRLPTWRLARDPRFATDEIPAQRIADHRRVYLDFEGPLTNNRGCVRRLDRGKAAIQRLMDEELQVELAGVQLRGSFEIVYRAADKLVFQRRAAEPGE